MQADLIIVGGGPVGLCAALALQRSDRSVVVLEAMEQPEMQVDGLNARSIALSGSTVQIFKAIGIWDQLQSHAAPMRHVHVSTKGQYGVTRLHADEVGVDALGYVVESYHLSACLLQAAKACDAISIEYGATVNSLSQSEDRVDIDFTQADQTLELSGELCLIADGARSKLRASIGIDVDQVDYGQSLIICNAEVSKPQAGTAFERFTDQGPLAMLPLGAERYACVWTMSPENAESRMALESNDFVNELQDCFGMRLGYINRVGDRFSIPLYRTSTQKLTAGRCLMLGNAANALHPVAGQSYNLSIRDIAVLQNLMANNIDFRDREQVNELMQAFSKDREREQKQVIRYSDTLVSLFSNNLSPIKQGRGIGLAALDLFNPLKTHLAFLGMGLAFGGNPMLRGKR